MPVTLVIKLPRTPLTGQVQPLVRALAPLAEPLLRAAIDASGLGLPARLLLHAALHAAGPSRTRPATGPAIPHGAALG